MDTGDPKLAGIVRSHFKQDLTKTNKFHVNLRKRDGLHSNLDNFYIKPDEISKTKKKTKPTVTLYACQALCGGGWLQCRPLQLWTSIRSGASVGAITHEGFGWDLGAGRLHGSGPDTRKAPSWFWFIGKWTSGPVRDGWGLPLDGKMRPNHSIQIDARGLRVHVALGTTGCSPRTRWTGSNGLACGLLRAMVFFFARVGNVVSTRGSKR